MVPVSRRRLLAATGTVALAGCLSRGDDDPEEPDLDSLDDASLPEGLATVLSAMPDNVGGDSTRQVVLATPTSDADEDDALYGTVASNLGERLGVEADALDRVAMATYEDYDKQLLFAAGSFAASDVEVEFPTAATDGSASGTGSDAGGSADETDDGDAASDEADASGESETDDAASDDASSSEAASSDEPAGASGDAQSTDAATHVEDGFAIVAHDGQESWDGGLDAATVAHEDTDLGLLAREPLAAVLDPMADESPIFLLPSFTEEEAPDDADLDPDDVELAAVTQSTVDETTQETTISLLFSSAEAADDDAVEVLIESGVPGGEPEEETIERDGPRVVATVRGPLPEHQLPDDSPDLYARFRESEDGVELAFQGDEPADPANLEFRVDGEAADPPWAGDGSVEPGATYAIDLELFASAEVVWIDPEREDVEHSLGEHVHVPRDAFEDSYDPDARRMTIRYTGDQSIDASALELVRTSFADDAGDRTEESLDERFDALESGDEIVLEEFGFEERASLRVTVDDGTGHVYSVRAEPPGAFEHVREDGRSYLVYRGETSRPADEFVVRVDEEPIASQWSDEHDTLESGDRLRLDLDLGTRGDVAWTGGDEPLPVRPFTVVPDAEFSFDYDEAAGEVTVTHAGGEPIPADELVVEVHPPVDDEGVAWDQDGTVTEGDSVVVEVAEADDERNFGPIVGVAYDDAALDHVDLEDPEA